MPDIEMFLVFLIAKKLSGATREQCAKKMHLTTSLSKTKSPIGAQMSSSTFTIETTWTLSMKTTVTLGLYSVACSGQVEERALRFNAGKRLAAAKAC